MHWGKKGKNRLKHGKNVNYIVTTSGTYIADFIFKVSTSFFVKIVCTNQNDGFNKVN